MSESEAPAGGARRSRGLVAERRAKAYGLYLKGFGEAQIGRELGVSQSTVSRALEAKRRENVGLFEKDGENLLRSFFQEERDRYHDLLQEEWNHYYGIAENNVNGRNHALGVIRATLGAMSQMAGRLVAELDTVDHRRRLDELKEIVNELKEKREPPTVRPST